MLSHRRNLSLLLVVLLSTVCCCYAFQLPFTIPFFKAKGHGESLLNGLSSSSSAPRIAIIGAGASGSSAAFWISKARERFGIDVDVDVYERESQVGGRIFSVHPYDDPSLPAVELGAPIFWEENKNLWRASDEFNLTRLTPQHARSGLAVWDGETTILNWAGSTRWWTKWSNTIKAIWRYGFSTPEHVDQITKVVSKQFASLYRDDLESLKWDNVTYMATSLRWTTMAAQTFSSFLQEKHLRERYINELIEAATRLTYSQNVDEMHALQGAFSLNANGFSIQGGNQQLFEQFLKHSGARVLLNTAVDSISAKSTAHWTIHSSAGSANYKAVVIAAPLHLSGISVPNSMSTQIPDQPVDSLHVTVLTTTSSTPDPEYFALPPSTPIPQRVLTTYEGKRRGGKEPEFYSLSYEGLVKEGEWTVKIVSKEPISDEWLDIVFLKQVGWVYRKEWTSFPNSVPSTSFAPAKLDRGVYYINAFEPLISTMEMATIASRNVIDILLNEEFASSICGPRMSGNEEEDQKTLSNTGDVVLGWDC